MPLNIYIEPQIYIAQSNGVYYSLVIMRYFEGKSLSGLFKDIDENTKRFNKLQLEEFMKR